MQSVSTGDSGKLYVVSKCLVKARRKEEIGEGDQRKEEGERGSEGRRDEEGKQNGMHPASLSVGKTDDAHCTKFLQNIMKINTVCKVSAGILQLSVHTLFITPSCWYSYKDICAYSLS